MPFQKGNTLASTRLPPNLRASILKVITPDTLKKHMKLLLKWIDDETLDVKFRLECMESLHNRVLGKPREQLEIKHTEETPTHNLDNLSPAELDQWLALAEKVTAPAPLQIPPLSEDFSADSDTIILDQQGNRIA